MWTFLVKVLDVFRGPINWPKTVLLSVVVIVAGVCVVAYLDGGEKVEKVSRATAQLARSINRIECVSAGTSSTSTDAERVANRSGCMRAFPPLEQQP